MVALQRMVAAYKALGSAQIESESDIVQSDQIVTAVRSHQLHQSTSLKFQKKPARLAMNVRDPIAGTHAFYADGASFVDYDGKTNLFERRTFTGDLTAVCGLVDKKAAQLISPIVFLRSAKLPLGLGAARITGTEMVAGRPAYVIKGTYSTGYLADLGSKLMSLDAKVDQGDYTLWVDQKNYLLLKAASDVVWRSIGHQGKKPVDLRLAIQWTEHYTNIVQNPALNESEFRFIPPKGAEEKFIERRDQ